MLLNKSVGMKNRIIISICLGLYYLVCLMCLISISISIRVVLTRALYQFHGSVPGLRFGI